MHYITGSIEKSDGTGSIGIEFKNNDQTWTPVLEVHFGEHFSKEEAEELAKAIRDTLNLRKSSMPPLWQIIKILMPIRAEKRKVPTDRIDISPK